MKYIQLAVISGHRFITETKHTRFTSQSIVFYWMWVIGVLFFLQVRVQVNEHGIRLIPDSSITINASLIPLHTHLNASCFMCLWHLIRTHFCHWFLAFFLVLQDEAPVARQSQKANCGNKNLHALYWENHSVNAEEAMALFWQFLTEAVMECGCEMRWLSWLSACISSWLIHLNKCQRKI